jgi:GntR family transcriptional regulator
MKTLRLEKKDIPLYVQLEQIIKSKIMTGELMPGEQIPTDKDLAGTYQVSSITARQAVLNLVREGLLLRKQGKGTFVQKGVVSTKNILTLKIRGGLNDVMPEGLASQKVKVLDMGRISIPTRVAEALETAVEQEIMLIRRVRSENGIPISFIKNYLPLEIGQQIEKQDLLSFPMLHVLRNKLGLPLKTGVQCIVAVAADYEIASALSVSISSPVLYLETIIYAEGEKPVNFVQTFYRADRYKYTLNLDINELKTI